MSKKFSVGKFLFGTLAGTAAGIAAVLAVRSHQRAKAEQDAPIIDVAPTYPNAEPCVPIADAAEPSPAPKIEVVNAAVQESKAEEKEVKIEESKTESGETPPAREKSDGRVSGDA